MEQELILKHLPKERQKLLASRGVPAADFIHGKDTFDVLSNLVKYEVDIPKIASKVVATAKQARALTSILDKPLRNYVLGISSFPSDLLAKHLAIHIMNEAFVMWQENAKKVGRTAPLWHRVYGGWVDNLRDKSEEIPSLLVISNVNEASGQQKFEKVRDLLEKYSNIPRIVVLSGLDPITFFATKLYHPINAGIMIGPSNRIKET